MSPFLRPEADVGQQENDARTEHAEAARADSAALLALARQLEASLAAFRDGQLLPPAALKDLVAEHKALRAQLADLHRRDQAGDFDAGAHESYRERTRYLAEQLQAIRQNTDG